jgi:hypothetical protein
MLWGCCQVLGGIYQGLCGFWWGDCEDFVTLGVDKVRSLCYARLDNKTSAHYKRIQRIKSTIITHKTHTFPQN